MNTVRAPLKTILSLVFCFLSAHAAVAQDASVPAQEYPAGKSKAAPEASSSMDATWSHQSREFEARLNGGGFIPLSKIGIQGQDFLTNPGYALGAQLLWRLRPNFYSGLEFEHSTGGQHSAPNRKSIFADNSELNSSEILVIARISTDEGKFRPYAIGGVGVDATTIQINGPPPAGHVWADTGTRESRDLIHSFRRAPAFTLQIGLDYLENESQSFGVTAAYYYIASATFGTSPDTQALGLNSVRGPTGGIAISATMSLFGKR